jgi:Ca2+-binding EF-hand superfamily protein
MNHLKRNHFRLYTIACGLALSSIAFAADQASPNAADAQFKAMDANGDGRLSPAEHARGAKKMFDMMDANKDGKVTATEMDAAHEKVTGKKAGDEELSSAEKIKVVDKDGDGILTAGEHASGSKSMFNRMDADKDGFLSNAELAAGHARMLHKAGN